MSYDAIDERADRAFLVGANYGKGVERARILAAVEALADELAEERDAIRKAYREHNAGRDLSTKAPRRPDLRIWADAHEVVERKVRALARGDQ